MIADQLKKLKKSRKSLLTKQKVNIFFGDTEDMDEEMILNLVPVESKYLRPQCLHFDRLRLNKNEEYKFNSKFRMWLKSCVQYIEAENVEYLYDFLLRKYYIHKFNVEESVFIILPNRKYYDRLLQITKDTEFEFLNQQNTFSFRFIANTCINNNVFFNLFIEYFKYYDILEKFINEVMFSVYENLKYSGKNQSSNLYNIISILLEQKLKSESIFHYKKFSTYVSENKDDFLNLFAKFGISEEELFNVDDEKMSYAVKEFTYEKKLYENALAENSGRKFLNDETVLKNYLKFLFKTSSTDLSFTKDDIDLLNLSYLQIEQKLSQDIYVYEKLFKDLESHKLILPVLYNNYNVNLLSFELLFNVEDKCFFVKEDFNLFYRFVDAENYKRLFECLEINWIRSEIDRILKICTEYETFEPEIFSKYVSEEVLQSSILEESSDVAMFNTLALAKLLSLDLSNILIEKKRCNREFIIDYLLFYRQIFTEELYDDLIKMFEVGNLDLVVLLKSFTYVEKSKMLNEVVKSVLNTECLTDYLLQFVIMKFSLLSKHVVKRVLKDFDFPEKAFKLLEKYFECDSSVIKVLYVRKLYKNIFRLVKIFGYEKVFDRLENGEKKNILNNSTGYLKTNDSKLEMIRYIANNFELNEFAIKMFLNNYRNTIFLYNTKNWSHIKILICENLDYEHAQVFFEDIVDGYKNYQNDLDLVENLISSDTKITNPEKMVNLPKESLPSFRATVFDLLISRCGFSDIRVVPFIVDDLINYKKKSLSILIEKHQNIMGVYSKKILKSFFEISESLLILKPTFLVKTTIDTYLETQDEKYLLFLSEVFCKNGIDEKSYEHATTFIEENVKKVPTQLLSSFLLSYYKHYKNQKQLNYIFDFIYKERNDLFYELSINLLKYSTSPFDKYIPDIVENILPTRIEIFVFLSFYFKFSKNEELDVENIFEKLMGFYYDFKYTEITYSIAYLLKRNRHFISKANNEILKRFKEPMTIPTLKLLQVLYKITDNYDKCLDKTKPYLALVVDGSNKEAASEGEKLLEIIEERYKINPFHAG